MSVGRENNCQDKTLLMFEMCLQELLYSLYLDERAMQIQIEKKCMRIYCIKIFAMCRPAIAQCALKNQKKCLKESDVRS